MHDLGTSFVRFSLFSGEGLMQLLADVASILPKPPIPISTLWVLLNYPHDVSLVQVDNTHLTGLSFFWTMDSSLDISAIYSHLHIASVNVI
jgi:hypothetical protein